MACAVVRQRRHFILVLTSILTSLVSPMSQAAEKDSGDQQAAKFIAYHESDVRPLDIAVGRAWWTANTTGRDEDFAAKVEAQNQLDQALANPQRFAELKAVEGSQDRRSHAAAADRHSVSDLSREAGRPRAC